MDKTNPQPDTRKWNVPAIGGEVGPQHSCWTFCQTLNERDRLEVGQSARLIFKSGAGATFDDVTRTA